MTTQPVSFFADDMAEGGGLPIGQNYVMQGARFVSWDYNGQRAAVNALKLDLLADDGQLRTQYYSVGDPARIGFTPDGRKLTAAPTKSSNFGILMAALSNAGFPQALLQQGDIQVVVGTHAYFDGQKVQRTGGTIGTQEQIVPVPTVIHRLPGQAGVAAPGAPAAPGMAPVGVVAPLGVAPAAGMAPGAPVGAPVGMAPVGIAPAGMVPGVPGTVAPSAPAGVPGVLVGIPAAAGIPAGQQPGVPGMAPVGGTPAPVSAAPTLPGGYTLAQYVTGMLQGNPAANIGPMGAQFTKQELMMRCFDMYAGDTATRDILSALIFQADGDAALASLGYAVNAHNVSFAGGV